MQKLKLFSVKNKLNLEHNLNLSTRKFVFHCYFICNNRLVFFENKEFYSKHNNLESYKISKENTYFLGATKDTLFIGFSITLRKLKIIFKKINYSFLSLRNCISIADSKTISHLSDLYCINNWRSDNKFCSKCSNKTFFNNFDNSLSCKNQACNRRIFPRIDPTVIILIKNKNKILLARNKSWKENLYSCIAGFCEPNESLEETVLREAKEEVGLKLSNIKYLFSQFWPFTNNLMIGFQANASKYNLNINKFEIEDAIWVTKQQLLDLNKQKAIILPKKYAIAYYLINQWLKS